MEKNQDDKLLGSARLGEKLEEWKRGDIYTYFLERMDQDDKNVISSLAAVDIANNDEIMRLIIELKVTNRLGQYLVEGIEEGNHAREEIERAQEQDI